MPTARPAVHSLPIGKPVLIAAILLPLLITLELVVSPTGGLQRAVSSPASGGTVDPRLVIRAHTEHLTVPLAGGLRLSGSLSPALPGPNMLRLAASPGIRVTGSPIEVTVTMPGMVMAPVRATLRAHGRGYSGIVTLPMFGHYRGSIVVHTSSGRYAGPVTLALTLPGEH